MGAPKFGAQGGKGLKDAPVWVGPLGKIPSWGQNFVGGWGVGRDNFGVNGVTIPPFLWLGTNWPLVGPLEGPPLGWTGKFRGHNHGEFGGGNTPAQRNSRGDNNFSRLGRLHKGATLSILARGSYIKHPRGFFNPPWAVCPLGPPLLGPQRSTQLQTRGAGG